MDLGGAKNLGKKEKTKKPKKKKKNNVFRLSGGVGFPAKTL